MADKKQNPLVVFGLVAAIAIAAFFIIRAVMPERHPEVEMPPMEEPVIEPEVEMPPMEEPVIEPEVEMPPAK